MLLSRIRVVFNECKDKDQLVGTRTLESLFQGRLGVPVYHQKNARLDWSMCRPVVEEGQITLQWGSG